MRRDTILVYGNGYAVLRFKVDNPGITLFHCHIEWHVEAGLTMTFIEAPTQLQALNLTIPDSHKNACKKLGIPMLGNAVGRGDGDADDVWLNVTGENTEPPLEDWGALISPPTKRQIARGMLTGPKA
jgi:iron transport multicopper oxidase